MSRLTKEIIGVIEGEVYPRLIAVGEECPPELEAAAKALGALAKGGTRRAETSSTSATVPAEE